MAVFSQTDVETDGAVIGVDFGGTGPPVLLLHGFPETRRMWREVAEVLAHHFFVVAADLRGYGASSTPPTTDGHFPYSKRAMALDLVQVMARLGHDRFAVVGHDRGGRVAYRAALDHPHVITKLVVLDVLPVDTVWDRADDRTMLGFWPWSLLAQDAPLPEQLLAAAPGAVIDHALSAQWGTPTSTFDAETRAAYTAALADPDHAHALCEEYRAAATIDRAHDAADRREDRRISCPTLALWSESGPLADWYAADGGPLAIWRELAADVSGWPVEGGHFFPEEHPRPTAATLDDFLAR